MATIEPRLIHLLNQSQSPHLPHSSLPPIQDRSYPKNSNSRPLPLEPDAGQRAGNSVGLPGKPSFPGIYRCHDDSLPLSAHTTLSGSGLIPSGKPSRREEPPYPIPERSNSLRMILDNVDHYETSASTYPVRCLRDEFFESSEDLSSKKRHHGLTAKEDFPQLPHPLKKQKSANTVQVMPPIIQGLHEPPPNAALFPPIASGSFNDSDGLKLGLLRDFPLRSDESTAHISPTAPHNGVKKSPVPNVAVPISASVPSSRSAVSVGAPTPTAATTQGLGLGKTRRRAAKPRRKWSDEETNHLLLGVHKHGVGRWTDILEDSDFRFNDRTAGDLKDRFRTCCPDELRNKKDKDKNNSPTSTSASEATFSAAHGRLEIGAIIDTDDKPESPNDTGPTVRPRKSRAHRKKMEDLAELGIRGPFKKSHRRERNPFSEQDDKEILEGFEKYGPQWTKIQRDPKFHLANRQATDLRDRLRNKRPDLFNSSSKSQPKDTGLYGPLEPSVNMSVENSLNITRKNISLTSVTHSNSREDVPKWPYPTTEPVTGPSSSSVAQDWPEPTHVLTQPPSLSSLNNDMGISRLLLDDSQVNNDTQKAAPDEASSLFTPGNTHSHHSLTGRNENPERRPFGRDS